MTRKLFHPVIYDRSTPVNSLWESERAQFRTPSAQPLLDDKTVDVAIIGGGYCGLTAALTLAHMGVQACVLEAGDIGWGASGRNGGFCSIGASFLGASELKDIYGESETLTFFKILLDAVQLVENLSLEEGFDLQIQGPGIWTFAHKPSRLTELATQAEVLNRLGVGARIVSPSEFEAQAFRCSEQSGALFEPVGFGLHPLAYCLGLACASEKYGATLHAHSEVLKWRPEGSGHRLITARGSVKSKRVIIATNGWMPEHLIPELSGRMMPIMSNITVSEPLSANDLAAQGYRTGCPASNTRAHLAYLRMLRGNRLLFGGRGDTTGTPSGLTAMKGLLERRRSELFPKFQSAVTSHAWRGLISATRRLTPAIGLLPSNETVAYAFGCHGNGVAFMTWAGKILAQMIVGERVSLPAPIKGLPPRFPLPALRIWMLRAMLLRAHAEDEFL